ncbi:unnamed protein product [Candida verbasci]|uniref:Uncharacterized protein n=1 Tax=Candida verbasci TaxID=1227364 RepID=A0A9W4TZ34_9ASCO|nr:unnamed protein product [Candida verbasci]
MMIRILRGGLKKPVKLQCIRFNSKSNKYSDIEKFNNSKTKYNFGYNFDSINDLDSKINPEKIKQKTAERDIVNINEILESDPSLKAFEYGSPEYKEQMHKLHQQFLINAHKEQKREQIREGFKGLFIAIATIIGLISAHQIFMNYGSIKNRILQDFNYADFKDTTKELKNTKSKAYKLEQLSAELNDDNLANLQNSKEVSGLYYFGGDESKLPLRIPFFNNMVFKDVYVEKDMIIAITDKGKIYNWKKSSKEDPKLVEIPYNVDKIVPTEHYFYFLTNKGEVIYSKRDGFSEDKTRDWLGLFKIQKFNKIENLKNVKQITSGRSHVLLLTKDGKVLILNTDKNAVNRGQYGPSYSPFDNKIVPVNQPIDITLLNNEITTVNGEKIIKPRTFSHVASGSYFNIVSDSTGNVWIWGDNSYGQCGEINTVDLKPIPRPIFNSSDLSRICRNVIKNPKSIEIKKVLAGHDSSYLLINLDHSQDVILSFGNGIDGQLGGGKYKQISSWPEIVKSLTNLQEFNEAENRVTNIGISDISIGKNHLFITLDNAGEFKDVYACGANENGQLGNGKKIKSSKPIKLPKLIEPDQTNKSKIINDLNDTNSKRLTLLHDYKMKKGNVTQKIVAGNDASVIYYCK